MSAKILQGKITQTKSLITISIFLKFNSQVRVLKKKDARGVQPPEKEPDQVSNPSLPESLKKMWTFETFTVTVACECGP